MRKFMYLELVICFCTSVFYQIAAEHLFTFLNYYELADIHIHNIYRRRYPRDVNGYESDSTHTSIEVTVFNQTLVIVLKPNKKLFVENPLLTVKNRKGDDQEKALDTSHYVNGHILGDDRSQVHGSKLPTGKFDLVVNSNKLNDTIYIEPMHRYIEEAVPGTLSHIVYRWSDILPDYLSLLNMTKGVPVSPTSGKSGPKQRDKRKIDPLSEDQHLPSMHCSLHLFADHRFFEIIGKSSIKTTIDEMIYHIGQADVIFRSSSFDGRGYSNNIGFIIAKVTLYKTPGSNPMADIGDGADAQEYLARFSTLDHSSYCLGVTFTVVDFVEGVLGLAWIANPARYDAGICSQPVFFRNNSLMYFNTAMASFKNFGRIIPRPMYTITLTHEFGHSFGSEHDDPDRYSCAPGGADGNFLMFHISGDGLKPNHYTFSSCSINFIYKILLRRMPLCFQESYLAYCSNAIVDDDEECDCGTESTCQYLDPCCNLFMANSTDQCTLKPTSNCSPMVSLCCSTGTCDITAASERKVCSGSSECTEQSYCDGVSPECPLPANLPDGTLCEDNLKVCKSGQCRESVCNYNGYMDCYCTTTEDDCMICCQDNSTGVCQPAVKWGLLNGKSGSIPVNGLCLNGYGICDENGYCIFRDGSFSLADLSSMVKETANKTVEVILTYWYYAVLGLAGLLGLIMFFFYIHKENKPLQSLAYKDGRMAYVWFEARLRLTKLEDMMNSLSAYDPNRTLPYPIAMRRLSTQFPSCPKALLSRYILSCNEEQETVMMLILSGYPMRKLVPTDETNYNEE